MASSPSPDFQLYWAEFRTAALADDYQTLETLTRFPLEVRGVDDSMPTVRYKKEQFETIFKTIMQQTIIESTEEDYIETTMKAIVDKTDTVASDALDEEQRVEQLVFQNIKGRWMFVRAYVEE
jgi:hypothetical protein